MARTVKEWKGASDDSVPPKLCKLRILARQDGKCALTGKPFTPKEKPQFDHITPLWLGGKNCESNLQAIHGAPHKRKTAAEASVRGKLNATAAKHMGITAPAGKIRSAPFRKSEKAANRSSKLPLPPRLMFAKPHHGERHDD